MAVMHWVVLIFSCCLVDYCSAFGLFDAFSSETDSCEDTCLNTYPVHTYENEYHSGYCQRGCRFFSIMDSISFGSMNQTIQECYSACSDSHPDEKEDAAACSLGCDCQAKAITKMRKKFQQVMSEDDPLSPVFPFLYAHDIFSNMFDKMASHVSVRWSLYTSNEDGQLIVVQSQPEVYVNEEILNMPDGDDYKTSNYLESNLMAVDNSATPNIRNSQLQRLVGRDMDANELNLAAQDDANSDWLGCIAYKTGLPRLLLSCTIFLSAVVMIWLCLTTAATAPEQRVPAQKLSIYGDLEYLSSMDEKLILSKVHPQTLACIDAEGEHEAGPLPIKVKVQRI